MYGSVLDSTILHYEKSEINDDLILEKLDQKFSKKDLCKMVLKLHRQLKNEKLKSQHLNEKLADLEVTPDMCSDSAK